MRVYGNTARKLETRIEETGNDPAQVLADFIRSDAGRRFHLWIQHRDLRPVFDRIGAGGLEGEENAWLVFDLNG